MQGPSHKKMGICVFTEEREGAVRPGLHMESRAAPLLQILSHSRTLRFLNKKKNALSLSWWSVRGAAVVFGTAPCPAVMSL